MIVATELRMGVAEYKVERNWEKVWNQGAMLASARKVHTAEQHSLSLAWSPA